MVGRERIRGSLYQDSTDFFEAIMVQSLSYMSREQWLACRFGILWRVLCAAQDGLHIAVEDETATATAAQGTSADSDMGVPSSAKVAAEGASSSSSAAAVPPSNEQKETEQKQEDFELTKEQSEVVASAQLEVLRPILLFWSLIDQLHATLSAPAGSSYAPEKTESFLASNSSAWYRRWRRSFTRAASVSTFRSLLRRETDILHTLTGDVLRRYEAQCAENDLTKLFDAVGATEALAKEGFTVTQLLKQMTTIIK